MSWVRKPEIPKVIRISLIIDPAKYPELVNYLWNVPFGESSDRIRSILDDFVKNGHELSVQNSTAVQNRTKPAPITIPVTQTISKQLDREVIKTVSSENSMVRDAMRDQF